MPSAQDGHETAEVCASVTVTETETRALHETGLAGLSECKDEAAQASPGHREVARDNEHRMGGDGLSHGYTGFKD